VPDWDADSPELRQNLTRLLEDLADRTDQRETPTIELAREWQRRYMQGLAAEPRYIGAFRGQSGLESTGVRVGRYRGTPAAKWAESCNVSKKSFRQPWHSWIGRCQLAKNLMPMFETRSLICVPGRTQSG
jgi:hypothetical protein